MSVEVYAPERCLERARGCELLALQTVQEEARNKFRFLAAQWRAMADDERQLEEHRHINVMV
jgi:hypothetical protein